ncbi:MAG: penicillin acylase family protein [Vicinamibacterales bacterium]
MRKSVRRVITRLAVVVVVLLIGALGAGWWWVRSSIPSLDAAWALPGLRSPVEVVADAHGVPHVYARDVEDAWFMAGALHARDRLWQMELYRRAASGRLAELLGEVALPIDRRMLTLRIRPAAAAEWSRLGTPARTALQRYAEGVNAVVAGMASRQRPLEFQLLGLTPAPWTPEDSLAIGRLLAFRLAENHEAELVRHAVTRVAGAAEADRLAGRYPDGGPTVLGDLAPPAAPALPSGGGAGAPAPTTPPPPAPPPSAADRQTVRLPAALAWLDPSAPRANSNAWVVSGRRTATGRPLLANDPHLLVELPAVWYEQHLVAAGLDVQGVSVPGSPFVVIGHNARIAWGFTNTGADVQDLVVERIDTAGRRVQTASGWEPVQVEDAPIPVRGRAEPAPFQIWRTATGVVYADESLEWDTPPAWLQPDAPRQGEQRALVLKWSGFDSGGFADAFEALDRAGSWAEFQTALDRLSALSQNAVYADVDGNIGYMMTGQVPMRVRSDGSRPGSAADVEWAGTLGGASLPRVFNPESGFLATSNNPVVRGDVPFVTRDWVAPFRAARITEVLAAAPALDVAAAAALQLDRRSAAASAVLGGVDGALAAASRGAAEPGVTEVLQRLKAWSREIDGGEEATLFAIFEDRLWHRAFNDEFPDDLFRRFYQWAGAERAAGLHAILADPGGRWWDDIGTVERRESRDDIYLLAAEDAARAFAQLPSGARGWDHVHAATFEHPLAAGGRLLGWLFNRGPVPITGDGTTVLRVSYRRLAGFKAWEHPSWRQVLDVGGWDNSRVVLPTGQSGHALSPQYFDQNELWRTGQYRTSAYSRSAVDGQAAHRQLASP